MNYLLTVHQHFLEDIMLAAKVDSSIITAIPSFLFLPSIFLLIYSYVHSCTRNRRGPFKAMLYRECGFHWIYFYVTRLWFLMIKGSRCIIQFLEEYFQLSDNTLDDDCSFYVISPHFARGMVFSILLMISTIPVAILCIRWFYKQHIPDFLMWIAEDPWLHSEIGMSGHYLERPPSPLLLSRRSRTRRYYKGLRKSISADLILTKDSAKQIRPSKPIQHPSSRSSVSF